MKDTPDHIQARVKQMMMQRSGPERLAMGCDMFDTAKAMARASMQNLPEAEIRVALFKRFYGSEIDEQSSQRIIARIRIKCGDTEQKAED